MKTFIIIASHVRKVDNYEKTRKLIVTAEDDKSARILAHQWLQGAFQYGPATIKTCVELPDNSVLETPLNV